MGNVDFVNNGQRQLEATGELGQPGQPFDA